MRLLCAWLLVAGLPAAARAQEYPELTLEGRESVEQMKRFEPFLGRWLHVEYPAGTRIEQPNGGCFFRFASGGIYLETGCGPWDLHAEAAQVFWDPVGREFVFRLYSVLYQGDLMFEGTYEFPGQGVVRRTYRGLYGDGRIHQYRETWTLEGPDRMVQETERFQNGEWGLIFDRSVYERIEDR